MKILAVNPGSTSTKVAVYINGSFHEETIVHDREVIDRFDDIASQKEFRFEVISSWLKTNKWYDAGYDAVVGRGGLIKPVEGGVYEVNNRMLADLKIGVSGQHACNLGGTIADMFASVYGKKAYIVDPVVIDEMDAVAKFSGLEGITRKSFFHALNQKAVARDVAKSLNKKYDALNLIVAHLGGGISVGAHKKGRVVDVNNALAGDGPFAPERAGGLPVDGICELILQNNHTPSELVNIVSKQGGLYSYLGIVEVKELIKMHAQKDEKATAVLDAMIYQIVKEIGALSAVLQGDVDGIILTGGIAFSELVTQRIVESVKFIAPVHIRPGGAEMMALVKGVIRVLEGHEQVKEYI